MVNNTTKLSFSPQEMVPLSELQKAPGKYIRQLQKSKNPLLITQRGKPAALLVDYQTFENQMCSTTGGSGEKEERKSLLLNALSQMLPRIIREYKPEKIILFGSLATGEVSDHSDIDLLIIKKTNLRPIERRKELIKIIQPRVATDFFIYTPQEFAQGQKEGKRLFTDELETRSKTLYDKAA